MGRLLDKSYKDLLFWREVSTGYFQLTGNTSEFIESVKGLSSLRGQSEPQLTAGAVSSGS